MWILYLNNASAELLAIMYIFSDLTDLVSYVGQFGLDSGDLHSVELESSKEFLMEVL